MTIRRTRMSVCLMAGAVAALCVPAGAQTIINGRTAAENNRSAGNRAPGNMVTAGLARAQTAVQDPFVPVEITETSRTDPIRVQAIVDAIETVFDQLEQTLLFLGNRLAARAGLMPLLPVDVFFPPTDSSGGNGTDGRTDRNGRSGDK